jgi:serine protease AprX
MRQFVRFFRARRDNLSRIRRAFHAKTQRNESVRSGKLPGERIASVIAMEMRTMLRTLTRVRKTLVPIATLVMFGLVASFAGYKHAGPPSMKGAAASRDLHVIVQFKAPLTPGLHEQVARYGGRLYRELPVIDSAAYRIYEAGLQKLMASGIAESYAVDHQVKASMDITSKAVGADFANSSGWTGKGVGVAIIDSGITWHPDLTDTRGNFRVTYATYDRSDTTTEDLYGHGTHIAGMIGGRGTNSTGSQYKRTFKGVAPEVTFVNFAVLDRFGAGADSDVIAAIQQAISLKSKYNIRVMNLSFGRPVYQSYKKDPLCQAVEKAWKAGIVVVVAAGNNGRDNSHGTQGYGTINSPGNDPYVITVGAMKTMGTVSRSDDTLATYSSKGPSLIDHVVKPDIVAPGNQIRSTLAGGGRLRNEYVDNDVTLDYYVKGGINQHGDQYYEMSGTSMAAGIVSGAAALLIQKDPSLTPDQVKARLMLTASKNFPQYANATDPTTGQVFTVRHDIFSVGAGYLDINAALRDNNKAPGPALSPIATYDAQNQQATMSANVNGTMAIWGTGSIWTSMAIWGTQVINGTMAIWGTGAIWGTQTVSSTMAIWGTNAIWGTMAIWGTNNPIGAESDSVAVYGEN